VEQDKFTVIDLFAGAGGLSEGFHRNGFKTVAYVEKDRYACDTLRTRHTYWYLKEAGLEESYRQYLRGDMTREKYYSLMPVNPVINAQISGDTLGGVLNSVKRLKGSRNCEVDVLVGGPPCQAYSHIGRARDPHRMRRDPRKFLYKHYVTLLKEFKPKVFVFENVPGILTANRGLLFKEICSEFDRAGYHVEYKLLNAADFMVLENRKRVIIIGWRKDYEMKYPAFNRINHDYFVENLLCDVPPLEPGEDLGVCDYLEKPSPYLVESGIRKDEDLLVHHQTRRVCERDREIYRIAIDLWNNEGERLRYPDLPENLKTHENEDSFLDRFKVVAKELHCSHTIVAHIAKDGHYFIHPDEEQIRSISVREAARIQSFPDNYFFEGPRTSRLTQIGNAVPPLMAERIANEIKKMLCNHHDKN